MKYYRFSDYTIVSGETLPYEKLEKLPESGEVIWIFRRAPLAGRETFAVSDPGLLTSVEGVDTLCSTVGREITADLAAAIAAGRVRAVNMEHPRWRELLAGDFPARSAGKRVRVHLLGLGDVGSTLLMGLRLMGGDVIESIGICDIREGVARRWEFELNQIDLPDDHDAFPKADIVDMENLFDCDVFLFCASRFVPDTAIKTGDVRMAQYELNRPLVASYGRMAREQGFKGLFCVVSDPVDPLCRTVLIESNKNENGEVDYQGLLPHQVRGFGLGVMNARSAYYARRDARFADFLVDGRTFGPHGEDLVVANSSVHYDNTVSRQLTELTIHANLEMRQLGYKPYVAPALSSGALSLLQYLRGQWHCSSVYLGGVFFGVRNRVAQNGLEVERLALPEDLLERLRETMEKLKMID